MDLETTPRKSKNVETDCEDDNTTADKSPQRTKKKEPIMDQEDQPLRKKKQNVHCNYLIVLVVGLISCFICQPPTALKQVSNSGQIATIDLLQQTWTTKPQFSLGQLTQGFVVKVYFTDGEGGNLQYLMSYLPIYEKKYITIHINYTNLIGYDLAFKDGVFRIQKKLKILRTIPTVTYLNSSDHIFYHNFRPIPTKQLQIDTVKYVEQFNQNRTNHLLLDSNIRGKFLQKLLAQIEESRGINYSYNIVKSLKQYIESSVGIIPQKSFKAQEAINIHSSEEITINDSEIFEPSVQIYQQPISNSHELTLRAEIYGKLKSNSKN